MSGSYRLNYIITGASGFVAGHLIEAIVEADHNAVIFGLDLTKPSYSFLERETRSSIRFIQANLLDYPDVVSAINTAQPHYIIHLAAFSSVAYSWQNPIMSFNNNLNIFLHLLEAVREVKAKCRILSVGSSEQYGNVPPHLIPLRETDPQNPVSPYAVARVAQEYMLAVYVKGFHLDIIATRSFNHFGPRQDDRFVLSSFAKQIAGIRKGLREPLIHTGDLGIIRDFIDVRDVAKAYIALLRKGICGEIYNVCSGSGKNLGDCLHRLIALAGIECEITRDQELIRPVDNPIIIGDNTKLRKATGWTPEIPFETTLRDSYQYWLSNL